MYSRTLVSRTHISCLAVALAGFGCASEGDRDPAVTPNGSNGAPAMGAGADGADTPVEAMTSNEGASATDSEGQNPDAIENVTAAGQGSADPLSEPGPRATPAASSGCGRLALLSSGELTLDVDGLERGYVLDVPAGYDGNSPLPLVFAFHGATTSGAFFRSGFYGNLLSTMGDSAIVVHPDALGDPTSWNTERDLLFFDALLAELAAGLCVDEARVFATGHSSGGFFTNALGCQRGDVLRAIAPVSAGGPFAARAANGGAATGCVGEVAVWLAHAENDETVPFDNGVDSRDRWLAANGCSEATSAAEPSPCVEYAGCDDGLPVRWCVYQDGHDWPDFGPAGIWDFFSSF